MMTEIERRLLREAVETTRYMNWPLWERVEKKRGRSVKVDYICPPVPSNPSLSWDNALLRLVKFADNALKNEE